MKNKFVLMLASLVLLSASADTKIKPLPFHHLQEYCWMRLAEVIPQVTDRIILPIGTVEAHGACALGTDNFIPQNLAEMIWEQCNALIAPPINHGFTGTNISRFPGAIQVRPEIFEEYVYDVLKDLVRTGFRNILIINGHGGNTDPAKKAMNRLHLETGARFMIVDWWTVAFNIVNEVYGAKAQQSGHGDMEEAALVIAFDPKLVDRDMYEKLGRDNVGRSGVDAGVALVPAWATSRYPEKGAGYLDFDQQKALKYARGKANFIADTFLEAVRRWEMMESWKQGK